MLMSKRNVEPISDLTLIPDAVEVAEWREEVALETEIAAYKAVFDYKRYGQVTRRDDALGRRVRGIDNFTPIQRDDPSTWKRPNMDKLKASIRADWMGGPAAA